jgi:toxin HigB-1
VQPEYADKLERILARLDEADEAEDMDLPGYRLHPLKGDLAGLWSIMVSCNWRLVFRFDDGDADEVDLVDYH